LLRYSNLNSLGEAHAQTQDISAKGLCLVTEEALAADTPLDIWLQMPNNGEQIYIKGKVVWSNMIEPDKPVRQWFGFPYSQSHKYRVGVNLENTELNPILLALKAIQVRIKHY